MGRLIDLHGLTFNRLTVTGRALNNRHKRAMWFCTCSCGRECIVESWCLRSGNTKSCGCLNDEQVAAHIQKCWKHGYALRGKYNPLYRTWRKARSAGETQLDFLEFLAQNDFQPVHKLNSLPIFSNTDSKGK